VCPGHEGGEHQRVGAPHHRRTTSGGRRAAERLQDDAGQYEGAGHQHARQRDREMPITPRDVRDAGRDRGEDGTVDARRGLPRGPDRLRDGVLRNPRRLRAEGVGIDPRHGLLPVGDVVHDVRTGRRQHRQHARREEPGRLQPARVDAPLAARRPQQAPGRDRPGHGGDRRDRVHDAVGDASGEGVRRPLRVAGHGRYSGAGAEQGHCDHPGDRDQPAHRRDHERLNPGAPTPCWRGVVGTCSGTGSIMGTSSGAAR